MQAYSDKSRENDPHAMPDIEVFEISSNRACFGDMTGEDGEPFEDGWYYWYCFPGCLPDSDPIGPFDTEQAAIDAAQSDAAEQDALDQEQNSNYYRDVCGKLK